MKPLILALLSFVFFPSMSQIKIWKQTTAADFSAGTLDSVVVSSATGGEVLLRHPLQTVGVDTFDLSQPSGTAHDDSGNYLAVTSVSNRLYAQIFDVRGIPLTDTIRVNSGNRSSSLSGTLPGALLNDGSFFVTWEEEEPIPGSRLYIIRGYGQFFDEDRNKVSANVQLFKATSGTASIARPVADQFRKRYLMLQQTGNSTNGMKIYGRFFDPKGTCVTDSFQILTSTMKSDVYLSAATHRDGFVVTWIGTNTNSIGSAAPSYIGFFDTTGLAVNSPILMNGQTRIAFDNNGVCLGIRGAWLTSMTYAIYGQLLDSKGNKLSNEIELMKKIYTDHTCSTLIEVISLDGQFRINWGCYYGMGAAYEEWFRYWRALKILSGMYTSPVFDAGDPKTLYAKISWDATSSPSRRLKFQIRSGATEAALAEAEWSGPHSSLDFYVEPSGSDIRSIHNNHRFLQYRAFLESDTSGNSPILNEVNIVYTVADLVAPDPPSNVQTTGEHRRITIRWERSSTPDVKLYRVYRPSDPTWFREVPAQLSYYVDSAVGFTSTYQYGVKAVDSVSNESDASFSAAVSPICMDVFVSTGGTSSGDGSISKPLGTINSGIAYAAAGDTIRVLPGDFAETVVLRDSVALIGSGSSDTRLISLGGLYAIKVGTHTLIKAFTFLTGNGIECAGDSVTITENVFSHQGGGYDLAVRCGMYKGIVVSKNLILGYPIGVSSLRPISGAPSLQVVVRNNIIRSGALGHPSICVDASGYKSEIINNTIIVEGPGEGVRVSMGIAAIANNCFVGHPSSEPITAAIIAPEGTSIQAEYNDRWNFNGLNDLPLTATEFSTNPQFGGEAKNNYHFAPGSPCTDAGNPAVLYNDLNGTRNDLGAYGGQDPMPDGVSLTLAKDMSLSSTSGFAGDTVTVFVEMSNATGVKTISFDFLFDEQILKFHSASATFLTRGFSISLHSGGSGKISVVLRGSSEIASGGGAIVNLRFVVGDVTQDNTPAAIELGSVQLFDGEGKSLQVSSVKNGILIARTSSVHPNYVYVDANATAMGNGSARQPYSKIQEGIDAAHWGDTVMVAAGVYAGPLKMKSGVFVLGLGANVATVEVPSGPTLMPAAAEFHHVTQSGIAGFTLINNNVSGSLILVDSSSATVVQNRLQQGSAGAEYVLVDWGSALTLSDNMFPESDGGGMNMMTVYSGEVTVTRNIFHVGCPVIIFLYNGSAATITNNSFYLPRGSQAGVWADQSLRATIANNLFIATASAGSGIKFMDVTNSLVANNVFDGCTGGIDAGISAARLFNNILVSSSFGIKPSPSTEHSYNLFWNNGTNLAAGSKDATELIADPLFENAPAGIYTLQQLSPARDGGMPSSEWNDRDGSRNDIGLFGGPFADSSMPALFNSSLRVGSVSGSPGDTVTLPIYGVHCNGIAAIQLAISFDANKLNILEVHAAPSTKNFALSYKRIGNSLVSIDMKAYNSISIDSAEIVELVFAISHAAEQSAEVSVQGASLCDAATRTVGLSCVENGKISFVSMGVSSRIENLPTTFALYQNYPNPFNPTTVISYQVSARGMTTVELFDILGREVRTLLHEVKDAGKYLLTFDGNGLSSGVYFYTLRSGSHFAARKMVLLK